jgi:hypothetical protein
MEVDVLPIVEASTLHFTFVERKPERLDEVKCRAGREAGASGVAGVPVNLRMNENDVKSQGARD